jgi:DNA repair protein RecN (Recombination protein N)
VLHELRIENLLLIDRAELRLGEGLNAITGETGAGKTVLAHSLDLLMGGRARPQIVRPGAKEAYVEGAFEIPSGLLDDPELTHISERVPDGAEEIVLGRRVGSSGRTSAFVQGRSASVADLRALGGRLLAFYGQHEHRKLTLASAQMEILDGFAGKEHLELRDEYRRAFTATAAIRAELNELREREGARERDLDLYRYELAEIESAAPDPDEEGALAGERKRLQHAEGLRDAAGAALSAISGAGEDGGGATAAIGEAESALSGTGGIDEGLDGLAERTRAVSVELADLAAELRSYMDGVDAEPGRLQQVEERLDALERLKRKHGGSIESVLAHAEHCRKEIERLTTAEERGAELEARLSQAEKQVASLGETLSAGRREAAGGLSERVASELEQLAMAGGSLEVRLEPHAEGPAAHGLESVELLVATNPGIEPAPLRDAASGGELSRVMLALCGLAEGGSDSTLVFDEIDAGIGGNTARAVGERLRRLGSGRQLLCITHLPQVASMAATHFRVTKSAAGGTATATVERVEGDELVAEICRMLGADRRDEAASRHARELLAAA